MQHHHAIREMIRLGRGMPGGALSRRHGALHGARAAVLEHPRVANVSNDVHAINKSVAADFFAPRRRAAVGQLAQQVAVQPADACTALFALSFPHPVHACNPVSWRAISGLNPPASQA
jgi:hypothetical protein